MQIFKWLFKMVEDPQTERVAYTPTNQNKNCITQSEVVPRNYCKKQSQKTLNFKIISSCKNLDTYTEASFYSTLNLKSIQTMKINRENIARGLGISFNQGVDSTVAHVRHTKVLPVSDSAIALSSNKYCKNYEKSGQKAKAADKALASSKVKEILRWVAAAKTEMRGKCTSCKVLHFKNRATLKAIRDDELTNESPKISFRWEVENCLNTSSSVYSALSVSSSTGNNDQTSKSGSWITTDSEYVVLEL